MDGRPACFTFEKGPVMIISIKGVDSHVTVNSKGKSNASQR